VSGQSRPSPGDLPAGAQVASYRVDGLIGRGGMAVVYRATDVRLGRTVALKVLGPELAGDQAFRQRFIRESRAAAAVDHPHVIPVFEAGESDGLLFIATRYVHGGDVRALIERAGPLPAGRAVRIVGQVAAALDAAHAHGLVHRDVKPANMLLDASSGPDHVYLSDFGLSKQSFSATLTSTGQFLGTLDYMAPEQIQGHPVDGRADLYALACTAFEMLTGQPPFRRDQNLAVMWAQVSASPPSVRDARPDLPVGVDQVLAWGLAKSPADRPATCGEFAQALRDACEGRPGIPGGPGASHPVTEAVAGLLAAGPPAADAAPAAGGQPAAGAVTVPGQDATMTATAPGAPGGAAPASDPPGWPGSAGQQAPWPGQQAPWPGQQAPWPGQQAASPGQPGPSWPPGQWAPPGQPWSWPGGGTPGWQPPPPRRTSRALLVLLGLAIVAFLAGLAVFLIHLRSQASSSPVPRVSRTTGPGSRTPASPAHPTPVRSSVQLTTPPPRPPSGPAAVVTAYFGDINAHRYRAAYDIEEAVHSQMSFAGFRAGFAGTERDTVQIVGVSGDVVTIRLSALQTDGTVKYYAGTYTIAGGHIVAANIQQVG